MKAKLREDGYIAFSFDYSKRIVNKTKKVFDNRKFQNNPYKHWKIPLKELPTLEEEFPQCTISGNVKHAYREEFEEDYGKQEIPEIEIPNFNGELRDFQKVGVKKMYDKGQLLLGDEMGTGKTVHTIATGLKLKYEDGKDDFLVICPASLKQQWKKEIESFSDEKAIVIDGDPEEREELWQEDAYFYIMNYALLLRDDKPFNDWWGAVALDEITYIKNPEAKRTKKAKELKADHKYGLTGTPIENTAEDLFSIMDFIDEDRFQDYWTFKSNYLVTETRSHAGRTWSEITGYKNLDDMYKTIKPVYLRRTKDEVLSDLPEKTINNRVIRLNVEQRTAYNEYKQLVLDKIKKEDHFMGEVIMARMVCDHTELVNMSDAKSSNHDYLERSSAKMEELKEIREEVYANENKMLVFTNFKNMADIIEKEEENVYKVTGDTKDKEKVLEEFRQDEEPAMVVATDAIEYGANLQEANTVVHFDLPFNPSTLKQRNDRVHRMGQEKPVTVIKMLAEDTIEERTEAILNQKEELSDAVVEGNGKVQIDAEIAEKLI